MRLSSSTGLILRAPAAGPLTPARAIEKTRPASALQRRPQEAAQEGRTPLPRIQVELVSQGGTASFDPGWDGPRLLPTFVAQVMGQVMNQKMPDRRSALALETAYGSAPVARKALLLDRRS